jgi:hypothetical protein
MDQEILVYSHCGCEGGFSERASDVLAAHGFTKVYNMYGGILAWQSAGYPFWIAGRSYSFPIETNSTIIDFIYHPSIKQINLTIEGPTGTTGTTKITLGKDVSEKLSVSLDDDPHTFELVKGDTNNFLYLTYTHSEHEMIINISETIAGGFPYLIIVIGVSAIALITILFILTRRKKSILKQ